MNEVLVCAGYYFCRIDKSMDSFKKKLVLAYEASGGRKVNIISHSMGGLLILCFLSLFRDVRFLTCCSICQRHYTCD